MSLIIYFQEGDDTEVEEICEDMNRNLQNLVSKVSR